MTTDKYAEVFRAAGLGVLLYDHYGFGGDSGGEPRRQVNTSLQARGYRDALYPSPEFDRASRVQVDFLIRHLLGRM